MHDLAEFWRAQAQWSGVAFGADTKRGPIGPLKHLLREVATELLGIPRDDVTALLAKANPHAAGVSDLGEYVDAQFLLFDACRRAGFTHPELVEACFEKLALNRRRTWPKPTDDEPVEHVRGEADGR